MIADLRVSPDGNLVAFTSNDNSLWSVRTVDRSGQSRVLVHDWSRTHGIAFSADGREIWLTGTAVGSGRRDELHAIAIDGSMRTPRLVLRAPASLTLHDIQGRAICRGSIDPVSPGCPITVTRSSSTK